MTDLHANAQRVADAARGLGLEIEVRRFPEGTRTAADAAAAIGVDVAQIVKSLIFAVDGEVVLAYVSGEVEDHDSEVEQARWMALEDAARELTYAGEREMAARALSRTRTA